MTGFGMGMVFVPMFDVILAGVAPHELGSASGLLESVQQLAMSIGIAAVGTVLFDQLGSGHGPAAFVGAAKSRAVRRDRDCWSPPSPPFSASRSTHALIELSAPGASPQRSSLSSAETSPSPAPTGGGLARLPVRS